MKNNHKPIKVIIVEPFNPFTSEYHAKPDEDLFYVASWGGLWARKLKNRYPGIDLELWSPESVFNEITYRKAFDVDCIFFPAKHFIVPRIITLTMLKRLRQYAKDYKLVIHINCIFQWRYNILMPLLFPDAKFILSHHGGVFPNGQSLKQYLKRKMLQFSYKNIDSITYLRKNTKSIIRHSNQKINLTFVPVGANFDYFKPLDKFECRKQLNLPLDKVFAVYVGAFYRLKGVDHILYLYSKLKHKNLEMMLVGGNKNHELYHEVVKSGCRHWGYVNHDLLRIILSAADFYIHPAFNKNFGGMDVSWMEALACNRPVLTPQFKDLNFDYSDLGILLDREDNLFQKTEEMMQSYHKFTNCRESAIKHLDGNTAIIDKLYGIYT
jgi:glycosyltransferase involved in cell wall biosynthesis